MSPEPAEGPEVPGAKKLVCGKLLALTLVLPGVATAATDSFAGITSQYTEDWSQAPGFYLSGPVWDPGATFAIVYSALPSSDVALITSSNTPTTFAFFQSYFQDVLRKWAFAEITNNSVRGAQFVSDTLAFLNQVYGTVQPQLAQTYPGYPADVYKALIIQNLVHGYHVIEPTTYYETITGWYQSSNPNDFPILQMGQLTLADELASLLRMPTADCGEVAETVRVLGKIWGIDMRYVGIWTDYTSPLAQRAEVQSTHALDVLVYQASAGGPKVAMLVDALANLSIVTGPLSAVLPAEMTGDGIVASASSASDRYAALSASGQIIRFFNYYMHPGIREGYLKAGEADASLPAFMYVYYLESYPNALHTFHGATGWQVNTASYSLNQPLD
ncbi:MAG: hypothetical protein KGJ68_04305 [Gammaproteobacteria bacterium]|nr:hypothetical protein [Gammaproteobacteria bacterium]